MEQQNIFAAVSRNNIEFVTNYLRQGGVVEISVPRTCVALLAFANTQEMLLLLLSYTCDINWKSSAHKQPIMYYFLKNKEKLLHILLINGADPNALTGLSIKARLLHYCAEKGYDKAVEMLLAYGAQKNVKNVMNFTPYELAMHFSQFACAKLLKTIHLEKDHELLGSTAAATSLNSSAAYHDGTSVATSETSCCNLDTCSTASVLGSLQSKGKRKRKITKKEDVELKKCKIDQHIEELQQNRNQLVLTSKQDDVLSIKRNIVATKKSLVRNKTKYISGLNNMINDEKRLVELTNTVVAEEKKIWLLEKNNDSSEVCDSSVDLVPEFDCPICFELMSPPVLIYQCLMGHIYCSSCKDKPNMEFCPQCRQNIQSSSIRNRVLEKIIADKFKGK